ncbi:hypothetical protein CR513_25105, partial [Mucuna pruriens]
MDPMKSHYMTLEMEEGAHQVQEIPADVATIGEDGNPLPKPLIICYNPTNQVKVSLVIPLPEPQYTNSHAVPWKYSEEGTVPRPEENKEITNLAGIGGITRSGRVYAP